MGIEAGLIQSWEGWDDLDGGMQFYGCVLAVDMGSLKKGDRVDCVSILFEKCDVQVTDPAGTILFQGKVKLCLA